MQHLKLTFENIMQSKILYYDEDAQESCTDICDYLQIDNMPALDGKYFYERSGGHFKKSSIEQNHRLPLNKCIFDNDLLNFFRDNKHNVLFVFDESVIHGIVHISDYNRDIVLQAIQDDILSFERKLRQLILLHGKKNDNMRAYFEYKLASSKKDRDKSYYENKVKLYDNKVHEINSLGQFQLFDFSDIMDFASSSFSDKIHTFGQYEINMSKKNGAEELKKLRNLAMHGKNPVSINYETSIFSLDSLEQLFESLKILRKEYSAISLKIRQHPDFQKSIKLENRSKLDIIHYHHPKALEYFLGWE
jgi:hypothetical protein